jgi:hypothetical protein
MMLIGIGVTVVVLLVFQSARLFLCRFSGRSSNEVIPYLRTDNPEDLAGILDSTVERCLSLNLSQRQFRKEQLQRIRLCNECIGRRAHNVRIWQEWAGTELTRSRSTNNEEVGRAAAELEACCAEYRIAASCIQTQLYFWHLKLLLMPYANVPRVASLRRVDSFDLLNSYERIKAAALILADTCGGEFNEKLALALNPAMSSSTVSE